MYRLEMKESIFNSAQTCILIRGFKFINLRGFQINLRGFQGCYS